MSVCFGVLTCEGLLELIVVTLFSLGAVLYASVRRERSYLLILLYAASALLAYPVSMVVLVFVAANTQSILLGLAVVIVLFGSLSFVAYRYARDHPSTWILVAASLFGGVAVGWLLFILGFFFLMAASLF